MISSLSVELRHTTLGERLLYSKVFAWSDANEDKRRHRVGRNRDAAWLSTCRAK